MIKTLILLYVLCVLIYGTGIYLLDPKVDKLKLLRKLGTAILIGALASALLTTFVFLF